MGSLYIASYLSWIFDRYQNIVIGLTDVERMIFVSYIKIDREDYSRDIEGFRLYEAKPIEYNHSNNALFAPFVIRNDATYNRSIFELYQQF